MLTNLNAIASARSTSFLSLSIAAAFLVSPSSAQPPAVTYPPGCVEATFPDSQECIAKNWYLGPQARDRCAPVGPYPIAGKQVYIQDATNFCIMLPDPDSDYLKRMVYGGGLQPTILQGEGYGRAFCMGSYRTPGALPLPAGGVRSAHVIKGASKSGKRYIQISGVFDCEALGVNCTASAPETYDDGGQYDNVPFINCGKEPYSGVDASRHPAWPDYVEQAGNGIFCMRICEVGSQQEDPCNVKDDTKGCQYTMGITTFNTPGFDDFDIATGQTTTYSVSLPPPKTPISSVSAPSNSASRPSETRPAIANSPAKNHAGSALHADLLQSLVAGAFALIL